MQPQGDVLGLHGVPGHPYEVLAQRIQVRLLSQSAGKSGRVFATVEAAVYEALDAALVMVMLKLYSLELPQDLGLRSSHEPTMVLFGMVAPAGGRLVNVRRRCTQVSSDGGFFSMRS